MGLFGRNNRRYLDVHRCRQRRTVRAMARICLRLVSGRNNVQHRSGRELVDRVLNEIDGRLRDMHILKLRVGKRVQFFAGVVRKAEIKAHGFTDRSHFSKRKDGIADAIRLGRAKTAIAASAIN